MLAQMIEATEEYKIEKAKEYLEQYSLNLRKVKILEEQIQRLKAKAEECCTYLSDTPCGGLPHSKIETAVIRLIDLRNRYGDELIKLVDKNVEITDAIARLPDERHRIILTAKYILSKTLADIGDNDLHYADRWTKKIHKDALISFYEINFDKIEKSAPQCTF